MRNREKIECRYYVLIIILLMVVNSFAQEKDNESQDLKHIYEGNMRLGENDFVKAEAEYRKAISENPVNR